MEGVGAGGEGSGCPVVTALLCVGSELDPIPDISNVFILFTFISFEG